MSAVRATGLERSKQRAKAWAAAVFVAGVPLLAFSAWALDDAAAVSQASPSAMALQGDRAKPQLQFSASSLPRFDIDGANRSTRLDMTWLPPRQSAFGLSLAMTNTDAPGFAAIGSRGDGTSVDLGLHWRYTMDSHSRFDVVAWRRLVPADALTLVQARQPSYGARVEMQLSS